MPHNRRNAVVRRNIKKIRKLEPHEWKYLNITNLSYIAESKMLFYF